MPGKRKLLQLLFLVFVILLANGFRKPLRASDLITGSWHLKEAGSEELLIVADNYLSHTFYSQDQKKFQSTNGGTYSMSGDKLNIKVEFNSADKSQVGKSISYSVKVNGNKLVLQADGKSKTFTRQDNGEGALAGNWNITGRVQGDKMNTMTPGARKTIKLLSGKKFQWAAINTETGEFFGTGGGSYTFENGKYTENIEFFSRDDSRVGASLSFDGAIEDGKWIHKGLSSKGDKIHEQWSRVNAGR